MSLPNPRRALTAADAKVGRTFYVKHTDTDANVIRFYGPKFEQGAKELVAQLIACGHKAEVNPTPERAILSLLTPFATIEQTELHTWFERDRAHVELRNIETDVTIIEWWDEAVSEAVEDGFLNPRDFHGSAFEYAQQVGLVQR